MATMQIFAFEGTDEIRTLLINDEPYLLGKTLRQRLITKSHTRQLIDTLTKRTG